MGLKLFYPRDSNWDTNDEVKENLLTPNQAEIVMHLKENGSSSRKEIENALNIETNTMKYSLRILSKRKMIAKIGSGKFVKYEIYHDR